MEKDKDKIKLIKFIIDFERDDLEKSELKNDLIFGNRFDELYARPMSFLLKKYRLYKDYFN